MLGYIRPVVEPFGQMRTQSILFNPTSSRAPTPIPDLSTPRKHRTTVVTPSVAHARTGSTSTTRSGASNESSALFASLVESFPVPPKPSASSPSSAAGFQIVKIGDDSDDEEGDDALAQLEEAFNWCRQGGYFDTVLASATAPPGPPPLRPLPPLPTQRMDPEKSSRSVAVGLKTTFEPSSDVHNAILSPQAQNAPSSASKPTACGPQCPPPSIPLPSLPNRSASPPLRVRTTDRPSELVEWSVIDWAANCAESEELEPGSVSLSPTSTAVSPFRTSRKAQLLDRQAVEAVQQERLVEAEPDDSLPTARQRNRTATSTSSTSWRSSFELDTITADLSDLLASFQSGAKGTQPLMTSPTTSARARRSRAESGRTADSDDEAMERLASPRRQRLARGARKSSVMSTYSVASTSSTTSSQANTTGGYKAYKLVRKQPSFALASQSSLRRGSVATGRLTSDSDASKSDSEEMFDLAFDATAPGKPDVDRRSFTPRKPSNGGKRNAIDFTRDQYRSFSADIGSIGRSAVASEGVRGLRKTKSVQALNGVPNKPSRPRVESQLRSVQSTTALAPPHRPRPLDLRGTDGLGPKEWTAPLSPIEEPSASETGASPVKPAPIKPLVTASTAQSSYLSKSVASGRSALPIATSPRASLLPRSPVASSRSHARTASPTLAKIRPSTVGLPRLADSQLHAHKRSALAGLSYRISAVAGE